MPTVANILSKPLFKDFRLVSGRNGLNNKVTRAGFFEWEQDFQITKSFDKGEFVITTLSAIKDDPQAVSRSIKLLINNNVAAIAIKDVHFSDLPGELKTYSNEHNVPIMFFTDTYIDEVLYEIKNETLNRLYTSFNEIVLDSLISNDNLDNLEKENMLRKINPFFHSGAMMCAYISNRTDTVSISQEALDLYTNVLLEGDVNIPDNVDGSDFIYSFVAYKRGIFLIITSSTSDPEILGKFKTALINELKNNPTLTDTCIGLSDYVADFSHISTMFLDAIFANTSCLLDNKKVVEIEDAPFDHIVFKDRYLQGINPYYEKILERLSETTTQRSPLLETMITLILCNGNVDQAAQKLFQHKNTIRYRMSKLRAVFAVDDDMEFYSKMYFFSRIHFSKPFLDVFFQEKQL